MKILFVSAVLPYPLYSGGQIRIYNLLKILSRLHEVVLFSFIRNKEERQYIKELSFCKHVETVKRGRAWQAQYIFRSAFGFYPFLLATYANDEMRQKLTETLKSNTYDLIHIEPGYVWPSIPNHSVPLVVAEHNIEHTIYEEYVRRFPLVFLRPLLYADVLKLIWWEKMIWKKASHVVTVSDDDKHVMERVIDAKKITVVPNGVDLNFFPFKPKATDTAKPTILFVGNFSWIQNQDAVRFLISDIWPRVVQHHPSATLRIVGRNMPERLKSSIRDLSITLLEHVSEIQEEYKKADILLAPIRIGGGTKFKILEALAWGIPVLVTTKGAEGLEVTHGKHLFIADTPEQFVQSVDELLSNPSKKSALVKAARTCMEENYSWEHIAKKLDVVWREASEHNP